MPSFAVRITCFAGILGWLPGVNYDELGLRRRTIYRPHAVALFPEQFWGGQRWCQLAANMQGSLRFTASVCPCCHCLLRKGPNAVDVLRVLVTYAQQCSSPQQGCWCESDCSYVHIQLACTVDQYLALLMREV